MSENKQICGVTSGFGGEFFVPEMARNAGIKDKLTNHSLRRMTCQNLLSSGISPTVVIQLTGHKNVNSLQNYVVADDKQQQNMSNIPTMGKKKQRLWLYWKRLGKLMQFSILNLSRPRQVLLTNP